MSFMTELKLLYMMFKKKKKTYRSLKEALSLSTDSSSS